MSIKKHSSIKEELEFMRFKGNPRGENTGFECLDRFLSIKQGSFTFILAAPHHGKSELSFEIIINQAYKYGKKTLVYSPETGSVTDIYAEFIHKITGKPIFKSMQEHVDDTEFYRAITWIDEHFSIVDSDEKSYSFQDLSKICTDEHIILSDPWNELRHDMSSYGGRQDLYIEDLMGEIRRYCKKNKKHVIQTLHPGYQQKVEGKDENGNKIYYYPMPAAREAAGGQALLRKAMTWVNMWRPPIGMLNEMGMRYLENEVLIQIEKAKPKGAATKGITQLFLDWKRSRYFEDIGGKRYYAFEHEKQNVNDYVNTANQFIQPNLNFG